MQPLTTFSKAKTIGLIAALFLVLDLGAQDRHFSQFYASPLTMNPALTGAFSGNFRIAGIYRDQWRAALDRPFTTFSTALDFRFPVPVASQYRDAFGVGLIFYKDEVRNFDFTANEINISVAYHKALDFKNTQYLSAAFQGGVAQRNVNFNNMTFQDMFNQRDGYTFATAERFPGNNIAFGDLAAGINYSWVFRRHALFQIGAAMHHINQPRIAFFPKDRGGESQLYSRYQVHTSLILPFPGNYYLSPRLHFIQQGPHRELMAGANLRFLTNDYSGVAMHTGLWARGVGDVQRIAGLESASLFFGLEWSGMLLGMSYDIGISEISNLGYRRGAFEISLAYIGDFGDDVVQCPTF
jgi:type IX secretion system PorP/SprF family membrane protein